MKGFVPFYHENLNAEFPHSLEWFYIGLNEFMTGPKTFAFADTIEKKLKNIANRGNQAIFRVYLDYPGKPSAVPDYLMENGHTLIPYKNEAHDNKGGLSPDYSDHNLVTAMVDSITALGDKYDGDPRIAYITVGYLGHWGEWHTYPNTALMANRAVQIKIIEAFHASFKKTKYLLRYPDLSVAGKPCGYHDDSFAWATLENHNKAWHFLSRAKRANVLDAWQKQPIGGEIYPPIQKTLWDDAPPQNSEDYFECVRETHCSWLIANALFHGKWDKRQTERALAAAQATGYDLYLSAYNFDNNMLTVEISNKGVAPFYYPWPIEIIDFDSGQTVRTDWDITLVLPGKPHVYSTKSSSDNVGIRVVNPVPGGKLFYFSNEKQINGFISLK